MNSLHFISGIFRDPQGHGTPWALDKLPIPIKIPKDMGMVWEACMGPTLPQGGPIIETPWNHP